jgi:hypothetical protein
MARGVCTVRTMYTVHLGLDASDGLGRVDARGRDAEYRLPGIGEDPVLCVSPVMRRSRQSVQKKAKRCGDRSSQTSRGTCLGAR